MTFSDPTFWVALLQIIGVNIVLSGDNAVVIALAARSLPAKQQRQAVLWGSGAAVVMRIVLTIVAVELLRLPYLKLIGAALLLWIGIQLLLPEKEEGEGADHGSTGMIAAIRTILIADLVMSLDNVIAVAAAAKDSVLLLTLGLLISIPLVVFGSTLLMRFMERWPIIITVGAGLLGWVAGEMAVSDPSVKDWIDANMHWLHYAAPALGAVLVVVIGRWLASRAVGGEARRPAVDLASAIDQHVSQSASPSPRPRLLVAADGSPESLRAIVRFAEQLRWYREPVAIDLLSVQPPAHRDVSSFVADDAIRGHHHDQGMTALQPLREALERSGVPCAVHIGVGELAPVVARYATTLASRQVYLAAAAQGDRAELGAVVAQLCELVEVPIGILR
ncbi:MAG: YjbE family putative metal transport protein [Burkholderiales bacterium]|nr:YjbE family putative metal transport protein [Burkholderiales bacterium]